MAQETGQVSEVTNDTVTITRPGGATVPIPKNVPGARQLQIGDTVTYDVTEKGKGRKPFLSNIKRKQSSVPNPAVPPSVRVLSYLFGKPVEAPGQGRGRKGMLVIPLDFNLQTSGPITTITGKLLVNGTPQGTEVQPVGNQFSFDLELPKTATYAKLSLVITLNGTELPPFPGRWIREQKTADAAAAPAAANIPAVATRLVMYHTVYTDPANGVAEFNVETVGHNDSHIESIIKLECPEAVEVTMNGTVVTDPNNIVVPNGKGVMTVKLPAGSPMAGIRVTLTNNQGQPFGFTIKRGAKQSTP